MSASLSNIESNEATPRQLESFHDIKLKLDAVEITLLIVFGIISVLIWVATMIFAVAWQFDFWADRTWSHVAAFMTIVFFAAATMLLISFAFFRINTRVVEDLKNGKIADSIMLQRVMFIFGASPSVKIARLAARRGVCGQAVRTWWSTQPQPIVPIGVNFEPKPLDESEPVFQDLREGVIAGTLASDRTVGLVKRNITLSGGWPAVLGIGVSFMFAIFGGLLVSGGSMVTFVKFIGVVVLIFLLRFFRLGAVMTSRLIVPGGLLCRRSLKRRRDQGIRVYARSDSILWVARITPQIWSIVVARGNQHEHFRATNVEADMLLRAWLSPIDPPPLERLRDFE